MENKIDILNIVRNYRIVIYGTGYVAMGFYKALAVWKLDSNIECFVVSQKEEALESLNGIDIKSIDEFKNDKNKIICIAVHEAIKNEIEEILKEKGITNYIWIKTDFLTELILGNPIKSNVRISVDRIIQKCSDYRIAVRYLAIEQYFGKNDYGYDIYKKAQELHCGAKTAKKRLLSFCKLIQNWKSHGYQSNYKIQIDENNELLDGVHRTTLARYFQMDEVMCDIFKASPYYFEWRGSNIFLTDSKIQEVGYTTKEQWAIEDAYKRIRGEK